MKKKKIDALSNEVKGSEIVDLAKSEYTPYQKKTVDVFGAQPRTIDTAKNSLNLDVNGYNHQVDNYGLQHALKEHSDDQIPLTVEDFKKIPDILSNPDEVISAGKTRQGLDTILYKKVANGRTLYVEEIRTGNKTLSFKTMYNQKTPLGASLDRSPEALRLSQNEMPTPNSVNNNLSTNGGLVNGQLSPKNARKGIEHLVTQGGKGKR